MFSHFWLALSSVYGFDDSPGNQAEAAIYQQPQIDLKGYMARYRRQGGQQQEVSSIPRQDRHQGLNEISHR